MKSYQPEKLFDSSALLRPELADLPPKGTRRMSANPHANGGLLLRDLCLPNFHHYAVNVAKPGSARAEGTRILGAYLRDVCRMNADSANFRVVGPDETASNRLTDVFDATG